MLSEGTLEVFGLSVSKWSDGSWHVHAYENAGDPAELLRNVTTTRLDANPGHESVVGDYLAVVLAQQGVRVGPQEGSPR